MRHRFVFLACVLCSGILLSGCGAFSGTPYGPLSLFGGGGYRDRELGQGKWQVRFAANVASPRGFAGQAALYRVAELADSQGFSYFKIVDREDNDLHGAVATSTSMSCCISTGQLAVLTAVGMQAKDTHIPCEAQRPDVCAIYETKRVLADYGPSIHAKVIRRLLSE